MGFDYRRLWHYLNKYHDINYQEEKVHDNFVRSLYFNIKGKWGGIELFRGPKLKDVDGYMHGRPDMVALGNDYLAVIEAKVMRNGDFKRHTLENKLNHSINQLEDYYQYFVDFFGVGPFCYSAIKHRKRNSFELIYVPIKEKREFDIPEYAVAR
ncbi:MAG: hypothetical protein ACOCZ6_03655 [Nanoarchaeota archaeon]